MACSRRAPESLLPVNRGVFSGAVSVVVITDGEAITINEGKRSTGSRGRGIGILVCVGKNEVALDDTLSLRNAQELLSGRSKMLISHMPFSWCRGLVRIAATDCSCSAAKPAVPLTS